jgi:hypothetical protein
LRGRVGWGWVHRYCPIELEARLSGLLFMSVLLEHFAAATAAL